MYQWEGTYGPCSFVWLSWCMHVCQWEHTWTVHIHMSIAMLTHASTGCGIQAVSIHMSITMLTCLSTREVYGICSFLWVSWCTYVYLWSIKSMTGTCTQFRIPGGSSQTKVFSHRYVAKLPSLSWTTTTPASDIIFLGASSWIAALPSTVPWLTGYLIAGMLLDPSEPCWEEECMHIQTHRMVWLDKMRENSTYTYLCMLHDMAQTNVGDTYTYIHIQIVQHYSIECGRVEDIHTCTYYTVWLDQMWETSTYTYIQKLHSMDQPDMQEQHIHIQNTLHGTAWQNVGWQHLYIHKHITWHGLFQCRRTAQVCTYTPCTALVNWIGEISIYAYRHLAWHILIESRRMAHIYIPMYTCCTAWLNRMGEQHIYIQYTLHDMAWSNVGEQHICIHTHITQYSSVECGRAAHMHTCTRCMTLLDWMQVSAHIHTYKPYMVHLNWIWETSTYTYRHIEWHGSNE